MNLQKLLSNLGACHPAREWVGDREASEETWNACPRADWLLWVAAKIGVDRRLLVLASCACARTSLQVIIDEDRPLLCIEAAERWAKGEGSSKEVYAAQAEAKWVESFLWGAQDHRGSTAAGAAVAVFDFESKLDAASMAAGAIASGYETSGPALADMAPLVRAVIPWKVISGSTKE